MNHQKKHPFGQLNPDAPKELADYAPLIGRCECKSIKRQADQTWTDTTTVVWEYKYILNGLAVQDISWNPDNTYFSSIRQYNSDSTKWYVTFFNSAFANPTPGTWSGGMQEKDIVLYKDQPAPNGTDGFFKIRFKDISDKGFNWEGQWVNKTETFILPTWFLWCDKIEN